LAIERVVHEPISHARFVYVTRLRVRNLEVMVPAVLVRARNELLVQIKNILHQTSLELLYVSATPLPFYEFPPREKQILD
jgi:hypothetical protein